MNKKNKPTDKDKQRQWKMSNKPEKMRNALINDMIIAIQTPKSVIAVWNRFILPKYSSLGILNFI